jgi:hypothetical protein
MATPGQQPHALALTLDDQSIALVLYLGTFVPNGRHLAAAAWLHLVTETIADIEGGALNA